MNGDRAMTAALCADLARALAGDAAQTHAPEVVICPPHILIPPAVEALAGSAVQVGAQDLDARRDGAFTGQISASMLVDSGCRYVIVGHSERRAHADGGHETDAVVGHKAQAALDAGLAAIVCLGETAAEREAGDTEQILARQLNAVLDVLGVGSHIGDKNHPAAADPAVSDNSAASAPHPRARNAFERMAIERMALAYEPVWAIGTGRTATPQQAQRAHRFIRATLAARDARLAATCRVLYGGSMNPANAAQLLAEPDLDGGLLGGAALKAADFIAVCHAAGAIRHNGA